MQVQTSAQFVDLAALGFDYESEELAEARARSWYARTPRGLIVLRYSEASEMLKDRAFRPGGKRYMELHGITRGALYDWWVSGLTSVSVEDHARLRSLVRTAFTARMVANLRPFMRATAERLAATMAPDDDCEFVSAFAEPLPALVMCQMLGIPVEDYDHLRTCANDISLAFSHDPHENLERVELAIVRLSEYITELVERRRRAPGDDLISTLITAEEDGHRLTAAELRRLIVTLVWAGQDTTARQLGRAMVAFAQHPGQWRLLAARPELAAQAVEEVCRWSPQTRSNVRYAHEDVTRHGVEIAAGTTCVICVVTANRDPHAFTEPDRFDITVPRKSKQLVFGGGIHYCLGQAVARQEMAEALLALVRLHGPPAIAGPVTWRPPAAMIHGPDALQLRFAAAQ